MDCKFYSVELVKNIDIILATALINTLRYFLFIVISINKIINKH